jgi:hypothetical protein
MRSLNLDLRTSDFSTQNAPAEAARCFNVWPLTTCPKVKIQRSTACNSKILARTYQPKPQMYPVLWYLWDKRVLLVVAAKRFPDHAKDLLPLARRLDFYADVTSLCLAKVMD